MIKHAVGQWGNSVLKNHPNQWIKCNVIFGCGIFLSAGFSGVGSRIFFPCGHRPMIGYAVGQSVNSVLLRIIQSVDQGKAHVFMSRG